MLVSPAQPPGRSRWYSFEEQSINTRVASKQVQVPGAGIYNVAANKHIERVRFILCIDRDLRFLFPLLRSIIQITRDMKSTFKC